MTSTAAPEELPPARTSTTRHGRQADSARRHQRVTAALERATNEGTEINTSTIARAAGVDGSFLYRHRDLLAQIHAGQATPPAHAPGPAVTRASLHADLLAAGERATRLTSRIRQLETRLSETLGEQAWHESGLAVPADIDALNHKITHLEQQTLELRLQLDERDKTSPPRAPPTASSWPRSTPRHDIDNTLSMSRVHHTCRARNDQPTA